MADPTRRAILDRLRDGGQAVNEIASRFDISRPAISKHLRVLLEARLVTEVRDGRSRIYRLNPQPLLVNPPGPYPFKVTNSRVTVEEAPIQIVDPASPLLNTPNKIAPADFDGWVQERGLYFADRWDARYASVLESHDPGEEPLPDPEPDEGAAPITPEFVPLPDMGDALLGRSTAA